MFGRQQVGALEKELRERRALLERREAEAARHAELAEADLEQRQLAADELAGKVSSDDVAERLDEIAERQRRHKLSAAHARQVADGLRRESAALERRLEEAPYEDTAAKLPAVGAEAVKASEDFARLVGSTLKAGRTLAKKRAALDEALTEAKRLCPAWREFDSGTPDEAGWPDGVDELVKLLQAGPRQPVARAAAKSRKEANERRESDKRRVREIVAERGVQLGGSRENDAQVLRQKYSPLLPRAEEVLDLIEAERERQRAAYEERQARKARLPHVVEA
jgi:hypothetical protein